MPSVTRLESATASLEARGDVRGVVQLVERWAEVAEPTPRARIAEARAFLKLGLTDRAWVSLKGVAEPALNGTGAPPPASFDALFLTGRMFVDRGWHARARRPLELAIQIAPSAAVAEDVKRLIARADAPVAELPDEPITGRDDVGGLLALAERHLAAGAQIKARVLVERARRNDPENRRAADLLWALQGDFSSQHGSLAEMVSGIPDLTALADLTDEAEHTEEAGERAAEVEDSAAAFPTLFRSADEVTNTEEYDAEHTSAMEMVDLPDLRLINPPSPDEPVGGDTQIARVIRKDGSIEAAPTSLHKGGTTDPGKGFDLAEYRREMGMDDPGSSDYQSDLEDEDISRVVLVGRERKETTDDRMGTIESIEPDPTGEVPLDWAGPESPTQSAPPALLRELEPPPVRPQSKSDAAKAAKPVPVAAPDLTGELRAVPADPPPVARKPSEPQRRKRRSNRAFQWWLLAIGVVLVFGAMVLFLLVVFKVLTG